MKQVAIACSHKVATLTSVPPNQPQKKSGNFAALLVPMTSTISYYLLTSNYGIPAAVSPPPIHSTSVLIRQRSTPELSTITHGSLRKLVMGDKNLQSSLHCHNTALCRKLSPMTNFCCKKLSWVTISRSVRSDTSPIAGSLPRGSDSGPRRGEGRRGKGGRPLWPSAWDHTPP